MSNKSNNIFNIPTILTLCRIVFILPLLMFMMEGAKLPAFVLFLLLLLTDYFDGFLARKLNQISSLGAFLDPIADKLLVATVLIVLVAQDVVHGVWIIAPIIIVLREIWVPALRGFIGYDKDIAQVSTLAKWKTAIQMVALLALLSPIDIEIYGLSALSVAALLTLITAMDYTYKAWPYLTNSQNS